MIASFHLKKEHSLFLSDALADWLSLKSQFIANVLFSSTNFCPTEAVFSGASQDEFSGSLPKFSGILLNSKAEFGSS